MDGTGTFLIVSYNIRRIREWRAVFDSNLEDQAQYGIQVIFVAERLAGPNPEYPYGITLVATVVDPSRAKLFMSEPRWAELGMLIGIDMGSVKNTWATGRESLLAQLQPMLQNDWV
jgi:hypothetical protein